MDLAGGSSCEAPVVTRVGIGTYGPN